jgi:AraC family transcriptional activator of mtrCDE
MMQQPPRAPPAYSRQKGLRWQRAGSGGEDLILACGRLHVTYGQEIDLFGMLNKPLAESFEESVVLRSVFEAILQEFSSPKIGTVALTGTLMKQCLILLLRRLQENRDTRIPWIAVLHEKGLQRAL